MILGTCENVAYDGRGHHQQRKTTTRATTSIRARTTPKPTGCAARYGREIPAHTTSARSTRDGPGRSSHITPPGIFCKGQRAAPETGLDGHHTSLPLVFGSMTNIRTTNSIRITQHQSLATVQPARTTMRHPSKTKISPQHKRHPRGLDHIYISQHSPMLLVDTRGPRNGQ